MDFCSIFKLARVDVGNVSKKGNNMKGSITWSIFIRWFFNQTLVYLWMIAYLGNEKFEVFNFLEHERIVVVIWGTIRQFTIFGAPNFSILKKSKNIKKHDLCGNPGSERTDFCLRKKWFDCNTLLCFFSD